MNEAPDLFAGTISELANGPMVGDYTQLTEALMRRLSEKGLSIEQLAGPKMMNRAVSTLQARAREFGIAFPDYVPTKLIRRVEFVKRGDFYETAGEYTEDMAKALNMVLTRRKTGHWLGIPAHGFDDAINSLGPLYDRSRHERAPVGEEIRCRVMPTVMRRSGPDILRKNGERFTPRAMVHFCEGCGYEGAPFALHKAGRLLTYCGYRNGEPVCIGKGKERAA